MSNILPKSMHARTKASSSSSSNYNIIRFRFLWFRAKLAYDWYRFAARLNFQGVAVLHGLRGVGVEAVLLK